MRELTAAELQICADYDREKFSRWDNRNMNRFYKFLTLNGDDVEIHTVACRYGKGHYATRPVCVKEVAQASVDSERIFTRDVAFMQMSVYSVDWSKEGLTRCPEWSSRGWFGNGYTASSPMWKIQGKPVINPELLQQTERFKYCAWQPSCGDILDYLKCYAKHPRIELLVKSGIEWMSCKTGFVMQIEKDKRLMRFVMDNIQDIKKYRYGIDAIRMAYSRKIGISDASRRISDRRSFRGYGLPLDIDASKASEYMRLKKINSKYTYTNYLGHCRVLGMDLADTKVSFPHDFKEREKEVLAMSEALKRKNDAAKRREMKKKIADAAIDAARLEGVKGPFMVVLPKNESDLIKEGKKLHHCIGQGSYADRIASKQIIIAFIRRKRSRNVPFVTVSVDRKSGEAVQCYGKNNSKPEKRVLDFVHGAFTKAAKRIAKAI